MTEHGSTRIDPFLGTVVHVVASRQARPNLPSTGCPFCVGGLEAPEPYDVRSFPNRWPALGEGRCEVVLYTPEHDATFASIGAAGARRVIDLWAERTAALRAVGAEYVLVFENRGAEVGATISHPHGQIYAYDHVPQRPHRLLTAGWRPEADPGDRLVLADRRWRVWTQDASVHPISLAVAPRWRSPTSSRPTTTHRDGLAATLVDLFGRLDRFYDRPLPYMMWLHQATDVVGRRHVAVVQHRDRVALAFGGRATFHRRRGDGVRGVLQSRRPRRRRGPAAGPDVTDRDVNGRIVARAPGRVNLIGDHTDYTGGLVFPMAIDRWTEIDGSPADRIRLVSDDEPEPVDIPADVVAADVEHVEPRWGRFVAAVAAELRSGRGFDGHVSTTIPVGAGLSSSAALEVAVALALGFDGTPIELAQLARRAEHAATGVPTGIMDQLCIASAQHGHATLIDCRTLERHGGPGSRRRGDRRPVRGASHAGRVGVHRPGARVRSGRGGRRPAP